MQPHAPPRRKSSSGVIFAILLVVGFFFFCGLLVVAVGVFAFARADASRSHAMAQRAMAIEQMERARAVAEARPERIMPPRVVAEAPAAERTMKPIQVAQREITIQLNDQGQITLDGKSVEAKQLETQLRNAGRGREAAIAVTIKADKKCMFEHVASVLSVCQKLDIPNVRIATAD